MAPPCWLLAADSDRRSEVSLTSFVRSFPSVLDACITPFESCLQVGDNRLGGTSLHLLN